MTAHYETHFYERAGWLRAAVLGANDGIISTASLIIGVSSASFDYKDVLLTGLAALVAGAMSMAAGEYVSVSSQRDLEQADIAREQHELLHYPEHELRELTRIYQQRGLSEDLAQQVAQQLTEHDALASHVRDELGFSEQLSAKPALASISSALSFATGAAIALLPLLFQPPHLAESVALCSLLALALLGAVAAKAGGARLLPASLRVCLLGAFAMLISAGAGQLFDSL